MSEATHHEPVPFSGVKKLFFVLFSTGIGFVVALLLAEVVLRAFQLAPSQALTSANQSEFDSAPGIYAPNQDFVSRENPNLPHKIRINNLGYRGDDFEAAKPRGELRIFVTGDSFAFGDLVDNDQTLPHQLGQLLRNQCGNLRMINGGLAGSTIVAQSELIERAAKVDPDIVLMTFHENDLIDLRSPMWSMLEKNRIKKSKFPYSILLPIAGNTAIYHFLRRKLPQLRHTVDIHIPTEMTAEELAAEQAMLRQMKAEYISKLKHIKKGLQSRGVDFFYATFPHSAHIDPPPASLEPGKKSVEWGDAGIVLWAEQAARQLEIPTINLQSALREGLETPEEGYLLPYDYHPAPKGYAVAARAIADFQPLQQSISRHCFE